MALFAAAYAGHARAMRYDFCARAAADSDIRHALAREDSADAVII